jgi:hypothetical protein
VPQTNYILSAVLAFLHKSEVSIHHIFRVNRVDKIIVTMLGVLQQHSTLAADT